jgi:hypothetical protein
VYRSDTQTGTYTETTTGTFAGTSFTNTGLSPSTEYWYKVAASNTYGDGPQSLIPVSATTQGDIGTIPAQYNTLALKLAYIGTQFDNGVSYDITVNADESLAPTTVMTSGKNVTITLRSPSAGDIKTVSLSSSTGHIFTVSNSITLKLENIKLVGSGANNVALVRVATGGTLALVGSEIMGNTNTSSNGGGILVDGGTVTMFNGKIDSNTVGNINARGGGVYVGASGRFTMHGGIISGNKVYNYPGVGGGGVFIASNGYFAKSPLETGGSCGVIYGDDVGEELANTGGTGKAVYYNGKVRNTTLGGFDEISTDNVNIGWE